MLDMYRMTMRCTADKTALDECLRLLTARMDLYFPGSLAAFFVSVNQAAQTPLLITSILPQACLDVMQAAPLAEIDFMVSGDATGQCEFIDNLQAVAHSEGLMLTGGLPVTDHGQALLGGILCFAPLRMPACIISNAVLQDLGNLLRYLIMHDRDQQKLLQSQADMTRMALAIEGSSTGIWDRNVMTGEIHYSPGWKALLGYTETEISNRIDESYTRVHPDDLTYVRAAIQAHFDGQTENYVVEHRVRCKDGGYKWISSRGKVVSRGDDGRPLRMIGTTTDVTAMHLLSEKLQESADLVTCLTNEVPGLAYQYRMLPNGDESFSYVSEGIHDIYELSPAQMQDCVALIHERIHPDDFPMYRNALLRSASRLEYLHLEFRVNLPRQGMRWRQMDARPRLQADGVILWHGFVTDVTEHKRIEQELQELATIDFLTQIPNRRSFMGRMEEELARIQRGTSSAAAVLMCDLDNFKMINDGYGHAVGDLVLRHFAHILHDELRKSDYAGRVGGEEFAVVLAGANLVDASIFAQRVQKQLQETPVNVHGHFIPVTVSIGIAVMLASDIDADVSLSSSDMALYRAKENGRNCIVIDAG